VVFKDATVSTFLDEIKLRIEEGEARIRREVAEVADQAENRYTMMKEQVYNVDKRITANEVLKEQFELFKMKQEATENAQHKYKEEIKSTFNQTKEQFNKEYKNVLEDLHSMKA
jgi:hypothetical protein